MTAKEVAKELGVSRQRVSQLLKSGELKVKDREITRESVEEYKKNRKKRGRPYGSFKARD